MTTPTPTCTPAGTTATGAVHQLIERTKDAATSRCGTVTKTRNGEPLPGNYTGWSHEITCPDCRTPTSTTTPAGT